MGVVSEVLVKAIQKNGTANAHNNKDGSAGGGVDEKVEGKVLVNAHVERIDTEDEGRRAVGVTLRRGNRKIKAKVGVICNVPIWSLRKLLDEDGVKVLDAAAPPDTWRRKQQAKKDTAAAAPPTKTEEQDSGYLSALEETEMTRSFLHLHLALDAKGLDLDTMEAHYTVMAKGLYAGNDATTQPNVCGSQGGRGGRAAAQAYRPPDVAEAHAHDAAAAAPHRQAKGRRRRAAPQGLGRGPRAPLRDRAGQPRGDAPARGLQGLGAAHGAARRAGRLRGHLPMLLRG